MDYALSRANDVPAIRFETGDVPCRANPLGVKGAGEGGTIGFCPAVMNAISDALWRAYRVRSGPPLRNRGACTRCDDLAIRPVVRSPCQESPTYRRPKRRAAFAFARFRARR